MGETNQGNDDAGISAVDVLCTFAAVILDPDDYDRLEDYLPALAIKVSEAGHDLTDEDLSVLEDILSIEFEWADVIVSEEPGEDEEETED